MGIFFLQEGNGPKMRVIRVGTRKSQVSMVTRVEEVWWKGSVLTVLQVMEPRELVPRISGGENGVAEC